MKKSSRRREAILRITTSRPCVGSSTPIWMKRVFAPFDRESDLGIVILNVKEERSLCLVEKAVWWSDEAGSADAGKMQKMQEEIAQLEVTGESGAGLVKVTINVRITAVALKIDRACSKTTKRCWKIWAAAAFNDAARRIDETQKEKWPLFPAVCNCRRALRCHSDANQSAAHAVNGSTALPAGRWPEVGAAYGVYAIAARPQRRDAPGAGSDPRHVEIGHRADCRTFTEQDVCNICTNRVVRKTVRFAWWRVRRTSTPSNKRQFSGRYFVLMGHLPPLDGIGPDDIGLDRLEQRLESETIKEVILATNPTVEGRQPPTTSPSCARKYGVDASRIAHGVPVGGELEMVDGTTLSHSLAGRHKIIFRPNGGRVRGLR